MIVFVLLRILVVYVNVCDLQCVAFLGPAPTAQNVTMVSCFSKSVS